MKAFLGEFKKFIMRGNVIDLAVGVIIGGAFQAIVNSLVNDVVSPVISLATKGINFADKFVLLTTDEVTFATAEAAKKAGFKDIFKTSLIGITDMERLMGKKKFNEVLGSLVYKPEGKVTLVPESDKSYPCA